MNASEISVVVALVAGSLRAAKLWRGSAKVEVINVVVLNTLASGRSQDLPALLRSSGPGAYFGVALAVAELAMRFAASTRSDGRPEQDGRPRQNLREARDQLEREAVRSVIAAVRRTRRDTWLDAILLLALVFAGVNTAVGDHASGPLALGFLAATLLWISNVWGARSHATRMYAGAMALADTLVRSLEDLSSPAEVGSTVLARDTSDVG